MIFLRKEMLTLATFAKILLLTVISIGSVKGYIDYRHLSHRVANLERHDLSGEG